MACSQNDSIIEGRVLDQEGNPVEEVLIQVMGTDLFEYSDADGNFKIDTKERGEELIFNKDAFQFERRTLKDSKEVILKPKS